MRRSEAWAFVLGSPSFADSSLTYVVGGGFSLVGGWGIEGSAFVALTIGHDWGLGAYGSGGHGLGFNIGIDGFTGYVTGGPESIRGLTTNVNTTFLVLSHTQMLDPVTDRVIGETLGAGPALPKLPPAGASITKSTTVGRISTQAAARGVSNVACWITKKC
jgi:hypothetical protein